MLALLRLGRLGFIACYVTRHFFLKKYVIKAVKVVLEISEDNIEGGSAFRFHLQEKRFLDALRSR